MINQTFSPNYQMRVYGKVKGNIVNDLLIRWDIWGKVAIAHIDGKVKKDLLLKSILSGDMVNFEEDGNNLDLKDNAKEVKNGNVLFVINGEEHPELHSLNEAKEDKKKGEKWLSHTITKKNLSLFFDFTYFKSYNR